MLIINQLIYNGLKKDLNTKYQKTQVNFIYLSTSNQPTTDNRQQTTNNQQPTNRQPTTTDNRKPATTQQRTIQHQFPSATTVISIFPSLTAIASTR